MYTFNTSDASLHAIHRTVVFYGNCALALALPQLAPLPKVISVQNFEHFQTFAYTTETL